MFHHQHILKLATLWHFLLSTATAQTPSPSPSPSTKQSRTLVKTSLVFAPWDVYLSVVEVNPTATTYVFDNINPSRNKSNTINCHPEAYDRATVVNGPSTAGISYFYTECGKFPAYSHRLDCILSQPNTATCTGFMTSAGSTQSAIETANSSELDPVPCTLIAGIEKLGSKPATTVATTSGPSASVPQTSFPSPTAPASSTQSLASNSTGDGSSFIVPFGKVFVGVAVAGLWSVM